jgi:hypothetical protein
MIVIQEENTINRLKSTKVVKERRKNMADKKKSLEEKKNLEGFGEIVK